MDTQGWTFGDVPDLSSVKNRAAQLVSAAKLKASQASDQLKQTPANISTVQDGLRGIDTHTPDSWDFASSLRSAKDSLMGFWRGYVAPRLR